jgi:hypothetical protein
MFHRFKKAPYLSSPNDDTTVKTTEGARSESYIAPCETLDIASSGLLILRHPHFYVYFSTESNTTRKVSDSSHSDLRFCGTKSGTSQWKILTNSSNRVFRNAAVHDANRFDSFRARFSRFWSILHYPNRFQQRKPLVLHLHRMENHRQRHFRVVPTATEATREYQCYGHSNQWRRHQQYSRGIARSCDFWS